MTSFYSTIPSLTASDAKVNFTAVIQVKKGQKTASHDDKECVMYDTTIVAPEKPADVMGPKGYSIRCIASNQKLADKWDDDTWLSTPGFLVFSKANRKLSLYIDAEDAIVVGTGKTKALISPNAGVLTCHFLGRITARGVSPSDSSPTASRWDVQLSRDEALSSFTIQYVVLRDPSFTASLSHPSAGSLYMAHPPKPTLQAFPPGTMGDFTAKFIRIGSDGLPDVPSFEVASMHGIPIKGPPTATRKRKEYEEAGSSTATQGQPAAKKTQTKQGTALLSTAAKVQETKKGAGSQSTTRRAKGSPEGFAAKMDNAINGTGDNLVPSEVASETPNLELEQFVSETEQ